MILDELMPRYDVAERHQTTVRAAPETVFASIREGDMGGALISTLFAIRTAPAILLAFLRSPGSALREIRELRQRPPGLRLRDFERNGFTIVAERAPAEIVIALHGRFWTPRGTLRDTVTVADFQRGPAAGYAIAGWNFTVAPRERGGSTLGTETRVWCAPDARAKFSAYWLLVRPGSGLIRRAMLRAIRRDAERRERGGR